jgi:hypothetical protein
MKASGKQSLETKCSSKMLVDFQWTTQHCSPEDNAIPRLPPYFYNAFKTASCARMDRSIISTPCTTSVRLHKFTETAPVCCLISNRWQHIILPCYSLNTECTSLTNIHHANFTHCNIFLSNNSWKKC